MVAAKEELAWCFVNEGDLTKGRDLLEEVVEVRDRRAEELEGKEDEEAFARARAWWRLGQTEWRIGGTSYSRILGPLLMSRRGKQGTCRELVYGFHASSAYICACLLGPWSMLRFSNPSR